MVRETGGRMMLYELHLTTTPDADVDRWSALCRGLGIKPLVIALAEGVHTRQVMMTATHEGDDGSAAYWCHGLANAFEAGGFPILRHKLEVPLDKTMAGGVGTYYEAHVKMLLKREQVRRLPGIAKTAGMHASRNLLVPDAAGREKWYLTARAYGGTRFDAAAEFVDAFALVTEYLPGVRMEMETVIADSNPALDEGWAAP